MITEVTTDAVIRLGKLSLAFGRVNRVTYHEDGVTPESDTDHTVMLGLIGCSLAARFYPHLDPGLVAQFALVHDLVEVYAGDTPTLRIDDAGREAKRQREHAAEMRLRDEFEGQFPWLTVAIEAYEKRAFPEARFVKALDKLLPKITHVLNGCQTLREQQMTLAELDDVYFARQAADLASYASDFPELLQLRVDLVARVMAIWREEAA